MGFFFFFFVSLFSEPGGAYYWREFCVSKQPKTLTVHGLIFGGAYYRNFTEVYYRVCHDVVT